MIVGGQLLSPITCTASAQAMGAFIGYLPSQAIQFGASSFYQHAHNIPPILISKIHQPAATLFHNSALAAMAQDAPDTDASSNYVSYIIGGIAAATCLAALITIIVKRRELDQAVTNFFSQSDKEAEIGTIMGAPAFVSAIVTHRLEWGDQIPHPSLDLEDPNLLDSELITLKPDAHPLIPLIIVEAKDKAKAFRHSADNDIAKMIATSIHNNLVHNQEQNLLASISAILQITLQEAGIQSRYIHGNVENEAGPGHAWIEVNVDRNDPWSYIIDLTNGNMGFVGKETIQTSKGERVRYELGDIQYYVIPRMYNKLRPNNPNSAQAHERHNSNLPYFVEVNIADKMQRDRELDAQKTKLRLGQQGGPGATVWLFGKARSLAQGVLPKEWEKKKKE